MGHLGTPELMIILAVVILLFGVGRIGRIGGELGGAVRAFREGLAGEGDKKEEAEASTKSE